MKKKESFVANAVRSWKRLKPLWKHRKQLYARAAQR
jgi:hypothetical protein